VRRRMPQAVEVGLFVGDVIIVWQKGPPHMTGDRR
jgi:hypothetical protein